MSIPKNGWNKHSYTLGVSPLPVALANEGFWGFPTKNGIILVVTDTGRGDNPSYIPPKTNMSPKKGLLTIGNTSEPTIDFQGTC